MRIFIAGLLGAIAMFIWTAIAHTATPLAQTGFSQMPGEAAVLDTMDKSIGDHPGIFIFTYVQPKDPNMMQTYAEQEKVLPSGRLLYLPSCKVMEGMPPSMLLKEFIKQFVETLISAWIVSMIV